MICSALVEAILRRSPCNFESADPVNDPREIERKEKRFVRPWSAHVDSDPLGLRERWIKTRESVRRYAEKRKASPKHRQESGGNHSVISDEGFDRIRGKVQQMRSDLQYKFMAVDHKREERDHELSHIADPPDKGGGTLPYKEDPKMPAREDDRVLSESIDLIPSKG